MKGSWRLNSKRYQRTDGEGSEDEMGLQSCTGKPSTSQLTVRRKYDVIFDKVNGILSV